VACAALEQAAADPTELVAALRRWLQDGLLAGQSATPSA